MTIRAPYGSYIPHHTAQRARIATPMYHRLAMTAVVDTLLHLSNLPRHSEEGKARRGNPHPLWQPYPTPHCLKEYGLSRLAAQASQ